MYSLFAFTTPGSLAAMLTLFSLCFTQPTSRHFQQLLTAWILCPGRHTISHVIQVLRSAGDTHHHSVFYNFFARSAWMMDDLSKVLFTMALKRIDGVVRAAIDDTLHRRTGAHLFGAAMHYDSALSTYGRWNKAVKIFSFGHDWVVLSLLLPLPWGQDKWIALPLLFRLYRGKKLTPGEQYKKRTELARQLLDLFIQWVPDGRPIHVAGDHEYSCTNLIKNLPDRVSYTGPLPADAALYGFPTPREGRGRPRTKGVQLPKPKDLLKDPSVVWSRLVLFIYNRRVEIDVISFRCLWYRVTGSRSVLVVVTRDPKGILQPRVFFTTSASLDAAGVITEFSRRWCIEVSFRDVKQLMGMEDPQNGWWRRRTGARPAVGRTAGPVPKGEPGRLAVERTVPFSFLAYGIVILWYLDCGDPEATVERARAFAPWYRHKREPSFRDMLMAFRRMILQTEYPADPHQNGLARLFDDAFPDWMLVA